MQLWAMPSNYFGNEWPEYYVFLHRNRDSDALTRSNFSVGLDRLGGESATVKVIHEGHWAVGWTKWIAIHKDDLTAIDKANEMLESIEDYPVLDESAWSELENNEFIEYVLDELNNNQDKLEEYLNEAGHTEGSRGSTIDDIDWNILQLVKDKE